MNRVWMITGAGRGLGRAFTEEAVKNGDHVIAAMRHINYGDPLMSGDSVLPVIMDVTDKNAVSAGVSAGVDRFGRIDVLVNNAGYGMVDAFEETTDEQLRALIETNFFGMINVTREVLPVMRGQRSGMILNLSSIAGMKGYLGSSAYCAAKFAVTGFTDALRLEIEEFGIQAASILPGPFRTDFRDNSSMDSARGNSISDYANSSVKREHYRVHGANHQQPGDPVKAARFIYDMVDSGSLPARIMVGKNACEMVLQFSKDIVEELNTYMDLSMNTMLDEQD